VKDPYNATDRQIAIDVLRGYFIVSMAAGHLTAGIVTKLLHVWIWVDGAAGFVCLSGFVLGLSQRARWERGDGHRAKLWILRRAALIWLVSILLTLAALSVRLFIHDLPFIEDIFNARRIGSATLDMLLLRLDVPYFGILAMYVVYLACAFLAVMALQERKAHLVLTASLAVYVLAQIGLGIGMISQVEGAFVRSTWQLLFIVGMVVGWEWKGRVLPFVRSRKRQLLAIASLGTVVFFILAHSPKIPYLRDAGLDLWPYFEKYRLDPAVIVYFVCLTAVLGAVIVAAWELKPIRPPLRVLALYGRHSLGCFVILSLVQLASWIVTVPAEPEGGRHLAWFALALILFAVYGLSVERSRTPQPSATLASSRPL
jgi:hypothetical protein